MDKFDEIERLGALRDKGLLTDEEFQDQKAKLLNPEPDAAPQQAATPEPVQPSKPIRTEAAERPRGHGGPSMLTVGLGVLAVVAVVAAVGFGLTHRQSPSSQSGATAIPGAPVINAPVTPPYDVNGVMPKQDLTAAWNALPAAVRGDASPDYLFETGGQYALVYSASQGDCHACGMTFSVAAITNDETGYHLLKAYPAVTASGSFGSAEDKPIGFGNGSRYLRVMGGWMGQGCSVGSSTIVRIAPGKPKEVLSITTATDNTGEDQPDKPTAIEAKLYPGPRSLTAKYSGTIEEGGVTNKIDRTVTYALKNGQFVLTSPGYDLPGC